MTISYNWLSEYLPVALEPKELSKILTSIGLEVEKMEDFEDVKGGLKGLVIGKVLEVTKHPNADKLTLTRVDTGNGEVLQIICGAPNVAAGQKVVVAKAGTTIYPNKGEPLTMKIARIRGVESQGMICAEDEIGLGDSHAGIMVLNNNAEVGMRAADYFQPYSDIIYEIGLTPNRMDAMSHLGVARDVCAYLSHHEKKLYKPVLPEITFKVDKKSLPVNVEIQNTAACKRYSGISIANIQVKESPKWMQQRLKAIGVRPINNIVDITNYVLHETGQPLHAFNFDEIKGKKVVIKNLPDQTSFKTLDEKERILRDDDLMICNAEDGLCIAGVFGGFKSGVTELTKNIFLESAYFDPVTIRRTSFRHGLRTDAATRFEKGVDISNTVNVLKRAAALIKEIAGGEIASDIIDVYPAPEPKKEVILEYQYLQKLSGKNYSRETVKEILESLGFTMISEEMDAITLKVPYHKLDISLPADIVEEIMRIDGFDNIEIPSAIYITPSVEENSKREEYKEKISHYLVGCGFMEIVTNSITNSKYFSDAELEQSVKLINNLSSELNVMRPSMLPTALEVIQFNSNRKNNNLRFFEFGKTYEKISVDNYSETEHLCLYVTGAVNENHWKQKVVASDIYYIKGVAEAVLHLLGLETVAFQASSNLSLQNAIQVLFGNEKFLEVGQVSHSLETQFDCKQPVFFADFNWEILMKYASEKKIAYKEVPKYPAVQRDLAVVVSKEMKYEQITAQVRKLQLSKLREVKLFDVFESEKIGTHRKSLAINFTFLDEEKTLTDKEIDSWMDKIMNTLEKELKADIRK
ncbi:MAG: phenylalanine--tRNA ligase subunit beta [Chitinophagaceae bacterium]|nr:phenylalanine--tRNA ligase subunit beta [Chitinophagaceae bacterium]